MPVPSLRDPARVPCGSFRFGPCGSEPRQRITPLPYDPFGEHGAEPHSPSRGQFPEDEMRIQSIDIVGFRGIPELKLEFCEQINVLVGVNGVGKSAVLDCIAIMLSRLTGRIQSSTGTGRYFVESDINNHVKETLNKIAIHSQGETVQWRVTKSRRGRRRRFPTGLEELRRHAGRFRSSLEEDESSILPLAVYYPVNRAVLDIPLRIRKRLDSTDWPLTIRHCRETGAASGYFSNGSGNARTWRTNSAWTSLGSAIRNSRP